MTSNTPVTQALLPVTQADRDAAADLAVAMQMEATAHVVRKGKHGADDRPLTQAFARHRISRSLPGDVGTDAIKKLVYRAYCAGFNDRPGDQFWNDREADFDAAIAALTPSALSRDAGEAMSKRTFLTCVSGDGPTPYLKVHFNNLADAHAAHDELLGRKKEAVDAR